jgi:hypothetical protein
MRLKLEFADAKQFKEDDRVVKSVKFSERWLVELILSV